MSRSIDERVVQMQFDNQQFERGVSTTLGTLGRLKDALNFGDSSKGLDQFQNGINRFNFDHMSNAIDGLTNQFSAFGTFANRLIENLADSVYNFGTRTVKAMSIDNITAGWNKFDNLTKSTATLVSQGYELETVNAELERLNWFTDETSYNFTDMVSNIGKFTASGQGLNDSVNAMQGIATWAALSGQNAATASRAMYQLSQAMGKGALRYDDWRSIQNASMDTIEFRRKAAEAATVALDKEGESAATLQKITEDTYKILSTGKVVSLNELFTSEYLTRTNWLSSDVMMQTFKSYSAAVDQIYEYVEKNGGTASEAMEALGLSIDQFGLKAFKAAQEARSWGDVVDSVADAVSTGWMNTFKQIFGDYEEATKLWTAMANELWDVFASGGERRNEILSQWHELGGYNAMIEGFANAWNGLKLVLEPVNEALGTFFGYFSDDESVLTSVAKQLVDSTKKFRDFTAGFKALFDTEEEIASGKTRISAADLTEGFDEQQRDTLNGAIGRMQKLRDIATGFVSVLDTLRNIIGQVFKAIKPIFSGLGSKTLPIFDKLLNFLVQIADKLLEFNTWIKESNIVYETLTKILNKSIDILSPLAEGFEAAKTSVFGFLDGLSKKIFNAENVTSFFERIKNIASVLGDIFDKIAGKVKEVFGYIGKGMKQAFSNGNAFDSFLDIVKGGFLTAGLGGILGIIKKIKDFFSGASNVTDFFETLNDALSGFIGKNVDHVQDLRDISVSMLILAGAVGVLSMIDPSLLQGAISAVGALMFEIFSVLALYNKFAGTSSDAQPSKGGIFGMILGRLFGQGGTAASQLSGLGKTFLAISIAIGIMALAVKVISTINPDQLGNALGVITALVIEMGILAIALSNEKQKYAAKGLKSLIGFAAAIWVLTKAIQSMASMDSNELGQGFSVVSALIIEMGVLAYALSKSKSSNMASVGIGALLLSASMLVFYNAIQKFAQMNPDEIKKGLGVMAGALGEVALFLYLAGKAEGKLASSVSMVVIAGTLLIIAKVMKEFGDMPGEKIGNSLAAIGGALTILFLAMTLMGDTLKGSAAMLVMAAALAVMTVTIKSLSGLSLEQLGMGLLAIAGAMGVFIVAGFLAGKVAPGLLALAGSMLAFSASIVILGVGLIAISAGVGAFALAFGLAVDVIVGAITTIVEAVPRIITAVENTITAVLSLIRNVAAQIPGTMYTVLVAIIQSIETIVLVILEYVPGAIVNIINAIAEAIRGNTGALLAAIANVISAIGELVISGIAALARKIPGVGGEIAEWLESARDDMREMFSPEQLAEYSGTAADSFTEGWKDNNFHDTVNETVNEVPEVIDENSENLHAGGGRAFGYVAEGGEEVDFATPTNEKLDEMQTTIEARKEEFGGIMSGLFNPNSEELLAKLSGYSDATGINVEAMMSTVQEYYPQMNTTFQGLADQGRMGFESKTEEIVTTSGELADTSVSEISARQPDFVDTGGYLASGLVVGLRSKLEEVAVAAAEIATTAVDSARAAAGVASPSKEFMKIGMYSDQGFAIGLSKYSGLVGDASSNVAYKAMESMRNSISKISDYVSDDMDASPVITPVLDLSEIQNGSGSIRKMLSRAGLSVGMHASSSANSISKLMGSSSQQMAGAGANGNSFVFTQNNYSPKALSNVEIYRQTKNQFSVMKRVLDKR